MPHSGPRGLARHDRRLGRARIGERAFLGEQDEGVQLAVQFVARDRGRRCVSSTGDSCFAAISFAASAIVGMPLMPGPPRRSRRSAQVPPCGHAACARARPSRQHADRPPSGPPSARRSATARAGQQVFERRIVKLGHGCILRLFPGGKIEPRQFVRPGPEVELAAKRRRRWGSAMPRCMSCDARRDRNHEPERIGKEAVDLKPLSLRVPTTQWWPTRPV